MARAAPSRSARFPPPRLVAMTSAMAEAIDTMLAQWQRFAVAGEQFNLQAEISRMTIDVIGRTLAGQDLLPHAESVAGAMVSTFDYFDHAFNHLFTAPLFIPTAAPSSERLRKSTGW
jgi:hypothetical protein